MRLQKQVNRKVDDKEYSKYVLVVPPEEVQKLQWGEGEELDHEIKEDALVIRRAKAKPVSAKALRLMEKHANPKRK